MIARPSWFWSSLFSSLTVNGVLFVSGACYLYSQTPIWEPPWPDGSSLAVQDDPVFIPRVADTLLGESTGKGNATDASPGETPMEARLADQDQSFLSRDPEGPGHVGDPPSMSTQVPGENGNGEQGRPAQFGLAMENPSANVTPIFASPPQAARPQPPPDESEDAETKVASAANPNLIAESSASNPTLQNKPASMPTVDVHSAVASAAQTAPPSPTPPQPTHPTQLEQQQTVQAQPTPQQKASQSPSTGGGKPGPAMSAADPAPQSDTESDPFSSKGVVVFRPGSTKIQFGRKHKIVRPEIGLAGQTALLQLRQPVVLVLALSLDETGKVTHVTILQSSGSKDIDQACKVAAYQWWIEPSKNKDGKPVKDVIPFVIGFS